MWGKATYAHARLAPGLTSGDTCDVILAGVFLDSNSLPAVQRQHSSGTFSLDPRCVPLAKLSLPPYEAAAELIFLLDRASHHPGIQGMCTESKHLPLGIRQPELCFSKPCHAYLFSPLSFPASLLT